MKNVVWRLRKSLYGLKQSGKNWNDFIHKFFVDNDFQQFEADPCVYYHVDENGFLVIVVWVDDIILTGTSDDYVIKIKQLLKDNFRMKDLGPINDFLGIQFSQFEGGIAMSQSVYLRNVLEKFDMLSAKPRGTPCELNPSAVNPSSQYEHQSGRDNPGSVVSLPASR